MLIPVAIAVAFVALFVGMVDLIEPRILRYRADEEALSLVRFGRFVTCRVAYVDIREVDVISWVDLFLDDSLACFKVRWWTNRVVTKKLTVLRLRDGRALICTPGDPYAFAHTVREHIARATIKADHEAPAIGVPGRGGD